MKELSPEYQLLSKQLQALLQGESNLVTNLSQFSALIFNSLSDVNWAGFYIQYENTRLQLGPFQGQVACTNIPIGKGVCGTSAEKRKSLIVNDVEQFEGHIACDSRSKSEIVCPVEVDGKLFGVFDLDSPITNRFGVEDRNGLEHLISLLVNGTSWS